MLADQFDAFLFDLDGVVYLGREPLPGATESLARLRNYDKKVRFLTNNPQPTREAISRRLNEMGVEANTEEIVSSGWATSEYLSRNGISPVYIMGSQGLVSEIVKAGVEVVDKGSSCEAVVVGSDEHLSYSHIRRASQLIYQGAKFIATNADSSFPSPKGPLPGTGAIVEAVKATTGAQPTVIGKPYPQMFDAAVRDLGFEADRIAMVGDTPDTDILGAHESDIIGILVSQEEVSFAYEEDPCNADVTISNLTELFDSREASI